MRNKIAVEKMLKYISKIIDYTKSKTYDDFINDSILIEACVFNLSQVGELANKIDKNFKNDHTLIPWKILYGLRNRIVHDYDGVNLVLIWDIVKEDLPELQAQLDELYISL